MVDVQSLFDTLHAVITRDASAEMTHTDQVDWFINKPEGFMRELERIALEDKDMPNSVFDRLSSFVRNYASFENRPSLTRLMFAYTKELFRKLDVKNRMESTFAQMHECRERIHANESSIFIYEAQIRMFKKDLE